MRSEKAKLLKNQDSLINKLCTLPNCPSEPGGKLFVITGSNRFYIFDRLFMLLIVRFNLQQFIFLMN
jgi:hypothetical protein